jgi:tape measure domain-containing protein
MADFSIEIPVGMDVSQVNAALKKFNGDIQQTAKFLKELKDSITGESQLIGVQFVATDSTKPAFKAVSTGINSVNKESKGLENQLTQLTKVYSGSVTSIRQTIAARKQELAGLRNTDTRYKSLTKEIEHYQQALNKAKGIQEGSITSLRQQQQKFQELADSLALGSAEQIKYANAAKKIETQIKRTTNPLGQFFGVLNKIATLQAGFTAFTAIIGTFTGSLNKFVGQLKALEGIELALKNVGLSTAEVNDRLQDATRISAELGAPLEQVEKSFKRMVPALEAVGVNAQDSGRFLEGIAARTQTLGLNTEQTGRFMEAFAQVLSKGKLQSEELNQQISELDGAFRAQLAKSLDVTTQQLEDMIQKGEITSKVFVKAFNDMSNGAEALKKRIQDGNATIQQLQNLIDLIDTTNLRRIGKAIEPGIKAILEIQLILAEFIETVSKSEVGAFLATVFNEIAKGARDFVKAVTGVSRLINALLEPIAGVSNLFGGLNF